MTSITKVLIANRGEIARRIIRTCHAMGLETVAVFSDADADAPHVREADEGVRIGPPPSKDSYLDIGRILGAAERTGADAIHPGYGFLAENPEFAEACENAGVVFIGPSAHAIRAMGSKQEAKRVVSSAGVPVIPGYDGEDQAIERLAAEARKMGFPVLIKASAGGGGKGMQVVERNDDLVEAIESARRVAESAFNDGTLLIERYIERPRHVEFQILGDLHGKLIHLFERECSIQRRHQKIIEETPSTALDTELRARMGEAAVKVGEVIGYQNAGTVEFILAPDGQFYFLEVNTRLQVEHPVTEMVTGLDLVREQIRIARGEPLGYGQEDVAFEGAAVECRLYAESPEQDFLPATGRVLDWHVPQAVGLRVDSGVVDGTVVGSHYDPMLAKIVTHGADRGEALARMRRALRTLSVHGLKTNQSFLLDVIGHPAFVEGAIDTHFIEHHLSSWQEHEAESRRDRVAVVAAALALHERRRFADPGPLPSLATGYRNSPYRDQIFECVVHGEQVQLSYRNLGEGIFRVAIDDWSGQVRIAEWQDPALWLEDDESVQSHLRIVSDGRHHHVHSLGGSVTVTELPRFPDPTLEEVPGGYRAPMPGKIISIPVEEGQEVKSGQTLLIMEAMKMEHTITAANGGTVERVLVTEGEQVEAEVVLIVLS